MNTLCRRSFLIRTAALGTMISPWGVRAAERYPARLVRVVVPTPPGSGTDVLARLIAEELRAKWGQPVIVDNRAGGAGGTVGTEYVARSPPDGYTLLIVGPGPLATQKFLYPKLGYEPSEFVSISLLAAIPTLLVVRADSPFKSVRDLIAYAKENPEKLNYASGGAGNMVQLTMELFMTRTGVKMQHIPYKGAAAATAGFLQGQADVMWVEMSQTMPHVKAGRIRVLAIGTESRSPSLPDVPTISETLPGFVSSIWFAMVAPPKTPPEVAAQLSAAVSEIMKQPGVVAKLQGMNIQPLGSTAAEMSRFVQHETDNWGKVIRAANITFN